MRTSAVVLCGLAGCVTRGTQPPPPDAAEPVRPVVQVVQVQAAHNQDTFFLRVSGSAGAVVQVTVAMTGRSPQSETRGFAKLGCFLACHDWSTGMPNWLPEDGERPMYLFEGAGPPLDVWSWRGGAIEHTQFVEESATRPVGGADAAKTDQDLGDGGSDAGTVVEAAAPWEVIIVRPLAGTLPLQVGAVYDVALAVHSAGTEDRDHYVSLPFRLSLDGDASQVVAPAVLGNGSTPPAFADEQTFPSLTVELFLPGISSWEFLVGAVVDRQGLLRIDDYRHGGARQVATETQACADCHQVSSWDPQPPLQVGGALQRLVLRRGGVFGPIAVQP